MGAPAIGHPLPRAAEAYADEDKWDAWILATPGHGADWHGMLGEVRKEAVRDAILAAVQTAPIVDIRRLGEIGTTCGVDLSLTINGRTGAVRTAWHYQSTDSAPRLVTAYPRT